MVLQNRNVSKRIDAENTPPPLKPAASEEARLPKAIREASRRRRAHANGTRTSRYAAEQAMRRSKTRSPPQPFRIELPKTPSPANEQADVEMRDAVPVQRTRETVALPRYLERPEYKEIPPHNIVDIELGLAETPIDYIRDGLEVEGPRMLKSLNAMQPVPLTNVLPSEFEVVINDDSSDLPTHMFAVFGRQPFTHGPPKPNRQKVTLYPVHDIVFAAHCAHLPRLRPNKPSRSSVSEPIKLPVVPVCLPSPQTFPILSSYLYTKRTDLLLSALLPSVPMSLAGPLGLTSVDETIPDDFHKAQTIAFAQKIARTFTARALLQHAMVINGVWRNVCALGVFEDRLWSAMDFAWEAVLTALAFATGNPKAMVGNLSDKEYASAVL